MPTTAPSSFSLALVDDHAVVRLGYRRLLSLEPDLLVVAEFASADEAEAALLGEPPLTVDALLLDLSMPGRSGLDLLRSLQARRPELPVLVVTMHDNPAVRSQCAQAGAAGFVSKAEDPQVLLDAVHALRCGRRVATVPVSQAHRFPHEDLTAREWAVFQQLIQGASLEQAAQALGVSEKTVSNNQTVIRQKLQVSTALDLLHYARAHGLIP